MVSVNYMYQYQINMNCSYSYFITFNTLRPWPLEEILPLVSTLDLQSALCSVCGKEMIHWAFISYSVANEDLRARPGHK